MYGAPGLLHVEVTELPGNWLLSFIDDGPGIPETDRKRVRKPFSPRSNNRSGGSLGLSIVEQVMLAHGGEMTFEWDDASRFVVQLQLRKNGA